MIFFSILQLFKLKVFNEGGGKALFSFSFNNNNDIISSNIKFSIIYSNSLIEKFH